MKAIYWFALIEAIETVANTSLQGSLIVRRGERASVLMKERTAVWGWAGQVLDLEGK